MRHVLHTKEEKQALLKLQNVQQRPRTAAAVHVLLK
jgi:hypothetical protein